MGSAPAPRWDSVPDPAMGSAPAPRWDSVPDPAAGSALGLPARDIVPCNPAHVDARKLAYPVQKAKSAFAHWHIQ